MPGTAKQLEISFIGMQTQTVSIVAGQPVHVTLAEDAEILDEVVVIGYQTVKRKDLTGSVASVSGEQIAAMPVANAAQALQGKLAGVNVTTQDGRPDAAVSIRVRGGGSISQSNDPLVLIDGVSGSLSDIPGDQIESIDVLKDASSTAIYGARGANGVILVTTKGLKKDVLLSATMVMRSSIHRLSIWMRSILMTTWHIAGQVRLRLVVTAIWNHWRNCME